MTWRDRLRPASFRGVPFRVDEHGAGGGRRVVTHEFPGSDERLVQDLGRATETFRVRGYVVGEDYDRDRDALLEALGRPGPGELVHPYLGTIRVQVTAYEVDERQSEGGVATFSIGFIEAGDQVEGILASRAGAEQEAAQAADAVLEGAAGAYGERVSVLGQVDQALEGVTETVSQFAAFLETLSVAGPLAEVAAWRRRVARLADAMLAVIAFPAEQARLVREAVLALDAAVESRAVLLELHLSALAQRPRLRGGVSAFSRTRDANARAVGALFRLHFIAEAARSAASILWPSRQEAERARDRILAELDALELDVPDSAFLELARLRAALVAALPGPDADLPELVGYEVTRPMPALVLAWELYGDRSREAELVARNRARIPHPGRIGTGTRLEVLSA